jgi:hypothetical protein
MPLPSLKMKLPLVMLPSKPSLLQDHFLLPILQMPKKLQRTTLQQESQAPGDLFDVIMIQIL